jgi:hypothetical protein
VRGANGRRVSQGHFRVVGCGAFGPDLDGGLGGEAEETALFLPVMRQVLAQPQQPCRRQLDRLTALKRLLEDMQAGKVQIVVVYKVDRLGDLDSNQD